METFFSKVKCYMSFRAKSFLCESQNNIFAEHISVAVSVRYSHNSLRCCWDIYIYTIFTIMSCHFFRLKENESDIQVKWSSWQGIQLPEKEINTAFQVSVFGVFLVRIQSDCGKTRTRKTPNKDTFHAVKCLNHFSPMHVFCTPWRHQKTRSFLIFSGCNKRNIRLYWV